MKPKSFEKILKPLDFDFKSTKNGLLLTSSDYSLDEIDFSERLVLEDAKKLKATAVLFRRMGTTQSSIPQLFIYDNTTLNYSDNDLAEIHKKIWSSGIVPIYYVVDKTQIRIFDSREPIKYKKGKLKVSPFEVLEVITQTQSLYEKYSAQLFFNGTFWEQNIVKDRFLSSKSAENKLIDGLRKIRTQFINKTNLDKEVAHKVLVLAILVKYLEERKDEKGKHVFPNDFFNKYGGAESFCDVIRNKKIVELFKYLSSHFNGRIFELSEDEEKQFKDVNLDILALYLDADSENGQYVFWRLYSFEYLPIEIISRIYEEFITDRADAVYTPTHLARFMVDECMPLNKVKTDFKMIDVSCGSGIFLVTVFKRLIQWWQKEQFERTGKLKKTNVNKLKSILLNSIYGIDVEKDAVRLSVFSLSIALCDMLSPTEIWTELKFEDLERKNLSHKDFFSYLSDKDKTKFDLVIGNPPFEDKVKDFDEIVAKYNIDILYPIPRNQIAMLFLQQSVKLLKKDGLLSLIMPSGPLLYNETGSGFRKEFFSRFEIPQIIDFSSLDKKSLLFERAVATAVIFAKNKKPKDDHQILHITVKRTKAAKEKLFFEIDHYDLNFIPQEIAVSDRIVWKTNLMGGGQLYYLLKKLQNIRTLGEYLEKKKKNDGWFYREGYTYGNRSKIAPHLTNKLMVELEDFTEKGILRTTIEKAREFEGTRERNKKIFLHPHLIIKETPGQNRFVIQYLKKDIIFRNEVFGIYTPEKQKENLKKIEKLLQRNYLLFKALLLSFSSRAGISRSSSTLSMKDFMALPYPENEKNLKLTTNEKIILDDILKYRIEELSKGETAEVNIKKVNKTQLNEFGKVLCNNLNSIYKVDEKQFIPLDIIRTNAYICFPLTYGKKGFTPNVSKELLKNNLSWLLINKQGAVHYRRVLRLYQKNIVYLIKPNLLRYWLKSIALRDASDIMIDLVNSGY